MPFQIIRNDITKVKADAIVNTANPDVAIGAGVDSAIYKAAGEEKLLAERAKIGCLEPGEVAITPAFGLGAKYIIHAVGCWWEGGSKGEAELLRQCYDKALELAAEKKCKSIAFPVMATGCYGFPQKLGMEIAVDAFTKFLEEHEMEIYLVVFNRETVRISGELGEEVREYIDDEYVYGAYECECAEEGLPEDTFTTSEWHTGPAPAEAPKLFAAMKAAKAESLDDTLKGMYTDSFEKHLQQLINKKGLKNSEVYAAANISKQYFSKLIKGQVKPSKEKVLALAVGLQLNMDEAVDFLRFAGYAFSPVSQTDVIVEYFIRHQDYNVMKIDIVLFDYGLNSLSS